MNTGGWAKVPGPLEDFRLTISNDQEGRHAGLRPRALGTTVPSQPLVEPEGDHSARRRPLPREHLNWMKLLIFCCTFKAGTKSAAA